MCQSTSYICLSSALSSITRGDLTFSRVFSRALYPRAYLPCSLEWNWTPEGSSVQINPFLSLFLSLAKGLWAKWPDTGSRAGGCHKPVFLGDSRDPCLTFRSTNVLFEMASGGERERESTGLQTRVPHLPLVGHRGGGGAGGGACCGVSASRREADCSSCCRHHATRE